MAEGAMLSENEAAFLVILGFKPPFEGRHVHTHQFLENLQVARRVVRGRQ